MKKLFLILVVISVFIACSSDDEGEYQILNSVWKSEDFYKGDSVVYYRIAINEASHLLFARSAQAEGQTGVHWVKSPSFTFINDTLTFKHNGEPIIFFRKGETLELQQGFDELPEIFYRID